MKQRKRTSIIWDISKENLQYLLDNSNTMVEVIKKIGLPAYNGNHKTINKRIKEDNLDITKLIEKRKKFQRENIKKLKTPKTLNEILVKNSNFNNTNLKHKLIKEGILENQCSECGLLPVWNNKPISLQLDHINGINNDNRLENLRILCPNCHTQTETYSGKRFKVKNNCLKCGVKIHKKSTYCKICSNRIGNINNRKFEISKDELINLIKQYPMTKVGELLGVSDNAVRKRCKFLDIDYKNL